MGTVRRDLKNLQNSWPLWLFKTQVNSCTYSVSRSDVGQTTIKSGSHVIISIFPHLSTRWTLFYLNSHFLSLFELLRKYTRLRERFGECRRSPYYLTVSPSFQSKHITVCNNISYFYPWLANLGRLFNGEKWY